MTYPKGRAAYQPVRVPEGQDEWEGRHGGSGECQSHCCRPARRLISLDRAPIRTTSALTSSGGGGRPGRSAQKQRFGVPRVIECRLPSAMAIFDALPGCCGLDSCGGRREGLLLEASMESDIHRSSWRCCTCGDARHTGVAKRVVDARGAPPPSEQETVKVTIKFACKAR